MSFVDKKLDSITSGIALIVKAVIMPRSSMTTCLVQSEKQQMGQPKRRSSQQARHKLIRFAYGAASASLRLASEVL